MARYLVLLPVEFDGKLRKQNETIEVAGSNPELEARARQGVVRLLEPDPVAPVGEKTADMQAAPAARGYKRRA